MGWWKNLFSDKVNFRAEKSLEVLPIRMKGKLKTLNFSDKK